jgi:plastocyanin
MSTKRVRSTGRPDQVGGLETALAENPARAAADRWRLMAILLAALIAVLGVAVSHGSAAASMSGAGSGISAISTNLPNTVVIKNFAFGPATMTVAPGTKITVVNQDRAPHSVTAINKAFDTGTIVGGKSGQITAPSTPGTYPYICTLHPSMTGTLIVK